MSPLNVRITAEAIDTWMAATRSDVIIPTDKKHPPKMAGTDWNADSMLAAHLTSGIRLQAMWASVQNASMHSD